MSLRQVGGTGDWPNVVGEGWLFNDGWSLAGASGARPTNEWGQLLSVFDRACRGDFTHRSSLKELLVPSCHHRLFLAALILASAIGGDEELLAVKPWIFSDWFTQAIDASVLSGDLRIVEWLLERREAGGPEVRETCEGALSDLLGVTSTADGEHAAVVRAHVVELRRTHGADARFVLGRPLHPDVLLAEARRFVDLDPDALVESNAQITNVLFHLETLTGIPFVGIVTNDAARGEHVDGRALREHLHRLEHIDGSVFVPGRRAFFGHIVPLSETD